MKTRTLLTVSLVALLFVPGLSLAVGSPAVDAYLTDGTVAPGERTTLDVVVLNEGDIDSGSSVDPSITSEATTARGVTVSLNDGSSPIDVKTSRQAVGTVPEGISNPVSFEVVVPENADPGTYDVPVRISYSYHDYVSDGTRTQSTGQRTVRVPVTVEDRAQFDVVDVDSNATVGSSDTVAVTVQNNGTMTARETRLTLSSSSQDMTVGGAEAGTRSGGTIEPGENRTVRYDVRTSGDADTEPHSFSLSAEYKEANGQQHATNPTSLSITPAPEQSFAIDDVSSTLEVGDDGKLQGVLTNTGDRPVEDFVLQWNSEQRNINPTETEYAVGGLAPGESAEFEFDVEVSDAARSGPRQFSLVGQYEDDDGDDYATDAFNLHQEVAPASDEFDVELVEATVSAGDSSTIELELTNTDDQTLSDVSAKLFADSPISAADDEEYVQSLEPGESTSLVFSISAGAGALEKSYPLSMDFQYDEPDGDTVTTDTYRVPVQVVEPTDEGGISLPLVGGFVLVAVLGVGAFFRYR